MCDSLIRNSRNEDMIEHAMNIAENRRNEIIKLQSIMRNNQYINDNKDVEHHNVAQYMITNEMIAEMRNSKKVPDVDIDFINGMIPAYEGAIKLWNNLIQYKIDPELRKISGNIMLEYGNEIGIFKNKKQKNN